MRNFILAAALAVFSSSALAASLDLTSLLPDSGNQPTGIGVTTVFYGNFDGSTPADSSSADIRFTFTDNTDRSIGGDEVSGYNALINHPGTSAIYPPLAQLLFPFVAMVSTSALAFKLLVVSADLAVCGLLTRQ